MQDAGDLVRAKVYIMLAIQLLLEGKANSNSDISKVFGILEPKLYKQFLL